MWGEERRALGCRYLLGTTRGSGTTRVMGNSRRQASNAVRIMRLGFNAYGSGIGCLGLDAVGFWAHTCGCMAFWYKKGMQGILYKQ